MIRRVPRVLPLLLSLGCGTTEPKPQPPLATKLLLINLPSATAETAVPLSAQPVVQAVDAEGKAVATRTTVTAEVSTGLGTVIAGRAATTDANGRAFFSGLTLGALSGAAGDLTLRFTAPGLDPVTADVALRCVVLPLVLGQTVSATLTVGGCTFHDGAFRDIYEISTSRPLTAVQLTLDATFFSDLAVNGPNDGLYYHGRSNYNIPNHYGFKALLAPGLNRVAVSSVVAGRGGSYSLNAAAATEDITCDFLEAVATTPITSSQQLGASDCSSNEFLEDRLLVLLQPNASIDASMTTGAFQPRLRLLLLDLDGTTQKVMAEVTASGRASLVFANGSAPNIYELILTSAASGNTGAYTLSVNVTNPLSVVATDVVSLLSLPLRARPRKNFNSIR